MKKKGSYKSFLVLLVISISIFALVKVFSLDGITFVERIAGSFQSTIGSGLSVFASEHEMEDLTKSEQELSQASDQKDLKALRDQFLNSDLDSANLLPVNIIGFVNYIPAVNKPSSIIINKGSLDGVKKGHVVVSANHLIGQIDKLTKTRSVVKLLNQSSTKLTGTVLNKEIDGLIVFEEDKLFMQNVLVSDNLEKDDLVVTKGDQSLEGAGIPPNLIIGRVESVDKKDNALFQTALIKIPTDVTKLPMVFVYIPN